MKTVDVILIQADISFCIVNNRAHFNISVSGMKLTFTDSEKPFNDILLGLPFACCDGFKF